MASLYPSYPPSLSQCQLDGLCDEIKDWSIAHGLAVRPSLAIVQKNQDTSGVLVVPAPVTLFPSYFPRRCFEQALEVQQAYNELYARISQDEDWLGQVIQELIEVDDFIAALWGVHKKVRREGYAQDLSLGLFRSDYLVHVDPNEGSAIPQIRQVEFNTISSSFGGLATQVSKLHRYLLNTTNYPSTDYLEQNSLPANKATQDLAEGIAKAFHHYGQSKTDPPLPRCVLFVVQSTERNIFDQRHLQYALESKSIPVFRLPFSATFQHTDVCDLSSDAPSRPLIYKPPHTPYSKYEVSVLYFRATYTPSDFPDESAWMARYHLERSSAIKCPSILAHLAGTKKVQQVLATPGSQHVGRFVENKAEATRVEKTFAAIYPMDDSKAGATAKSLAMDPERSKGYVLKPQREGGGNNIYRTAIPDFLQALGNEASWRGHILMELIEPPSQNNVIIRDGVPKSGEVIAELGVFGACLWRGKEPGLLYNAEAGYLLRTKGRDSEEGGVAAGFGSIDSACLVDI